MTELTGKSSIFKSVDHRFSSINEKRVKNEQISHLINKKYIEQHNNHFNHPIVLNHSIVYTVQMQFVLIRIKTSLLLVTVVGVDILKIVSILHRTVALTQQMANPEIFVNYFNLFEQRNWSGVIVSTLVKMQPINSTINVNNNMKRTESKIGKFIENYITQGNCHDIAM